MGKWLRKLFGLPDRDYVMLRMHDGTHMHRPVEWFCGRPFAAPYLPDTRCELRPGGKLSGQGYVYGWLPASPVMRTFFDDDHAAAAPFDGQGSSK